MTILRDIFKMIILLIIPHILLSVDSDLERKEQKENEYLKEPSAPLFSIQSGYAYSNWKMPKMEYFSQKTQGLNLFWIDLVYKGNKDNIDGYRNYIHYERSFNSNWDKEAKVISQDNVIGDGSYELIKGKINFPLSYKYINFNIFIKASVERYLSSITSKTETGFITENGDIKRLYEGNSLYFETKFNEIKLGFSSRKSYYDVLEYFFFFGDYQKPYTVLKNGVELETFNRYLFYSQIKNYGVGFALNDKFQDYSQVYFIPLFKFGIADIKLTKNAYLQDIGFQQSNYFEFKVKTGYSYISKSIKNLRVNIQAIYNIRYFDEVQPDGNVYIGENSTNKDIIKKIFFSLQYSF